MTPAAERTASIPQRVDVLDWDRAALGLDDVGIAPLGPILGREECRELVARYDDADRASAAAALDRMGAEHLAGRTFATLSSGERQRVLLARALSVDPGLVLLDEPFAGLDLGAREELIDRLAALAADPTAPPLVLVTHHVDEIPPGFTHGLLLAEGRVVAAAPRHCGLPDAHASTHQLERRSLEARCIAHVQELGRSEVVHDRRCSRCRLSVRSDDDLPAGIPLGYPPWLGLDLLLDLAAEAVGVGKADLDFRL